MKKYFLLAVAVALVLIVCGFFYQPARQDQVSTEVSVGCKLSFDRLVLGGTVNQTILKKLDCDQKTFSRIVETEKNRIEALALYGGAGEADLVHLKTCAQYLADAR